MARTISNRVLSLFGSCVSVVMAGVGVLIVGTILSGRAPFLLLLFAVALVAASVTAAVFLFQNALSERHRSDFSVTIRREAPNPLSQVSVEKERTPEDLP